MRIGNFEIDGVLVRVGPDASPRAIAALIRAFEGSVVIGPTGAVRVMVATPRVSPVDG